MGCVNKCLFIGFLGRDAEVKYTTAGAAVATLSLGCTETWKDKSGERRERVEWVRAVLWGKQAESLQPYLLKGKQIYLEGQMQTREWDDKEGNKRYTTEIRANRITLLGSGRKDEHDQRRETDDGGYQHPAPIEPMDEDDIPF